MKTVKITLYASISDDALDSVKHLIEHHARDFISIERWPEINSIRSITVEPCDPDTSPALTAETMPEFKGQIVDIFEDYCAICAITIENPERDKYADEAGFSEDDDCETAIIFGDDYDAIADTVERLIKESGDMHVVCHGILMEFLRILKDRGTPDDISGTDKTALKRLIENTFDNWHVCLPLAD